MAEVDFGDSELFEQLDDEPQKPVHIRFDELDDSLEESEGLRERVQQYEATIEDLKAENQELRRKLNILTRPSGLSMTDSKFDGPLLQILFMNSAISKQYHTDIEDFVTDLVNKYVQHETSKHEQTSFNVKPQPSSILLEEDDSKGISTMKKIKEAFRVVGSVLYFTNFCLDKLGQPLLDESPQLTEGWEVPKYHQMFTQIVSLEGQEVPQAKAKRPKAHCFNCGSEDHQLRDCPQPRDSASISAKRKAFMDACGEAGNQNHQQRYHAEELEERFARFKPGVISGELQEALGVSENHLPPFIYRMRQLGYPPGWLKDAEMENSGLSLYDGKDTSDGELEDGETFQKPTCISYDLSRLVNYPGFNTTAPRGCVDDYRMYGSIPMQSFHQKDVFANYLASTFPTQSPTMNSKRSSTSQSSPSEIKKQKTSGSIPSASPVDMEIDSDVEGPHTSQSCGGFRFQPPLPPGSPFIASPPPLPRGTPPSTPPNFTPRPPPTPTPPPLPKGTPPLTPADSPNAYDRPSLISQSKSSEMDDDTLTIEELEEQQRLIWAALEQSESTNSDSDAPADTPVTVNSVASSSGRSDLDSAPDGRPSSEETMAVKQVPGVCIQVYKTELPKHNPKIEQFLHSIMDEETASNPDSELTAENGSETKVCAENGQKNDPGETTTDAESSNVIVPDRSKFAVGITPFEYDNMAESTGLYLRLREVLKNSPRNQQKRKNLP
ncbi:zinc finger CCHC domain-containing protein 8 isoform X1 [Pleurodeles waltl]|uniref:zinc finger CCHC domain-containing protein 8 isoform X1 n=1 Tax=Pleurodeles waltl TaxID=8319 RepID=UPI0037098EF2